MRKLYFLIFLFYSVVSNAQPFGNEWIVYGGPGKYYSFPVFSNGIHRLDYNTLVTAGVPVASLNPKNFQVFGREQEQFIFVSGEQDNSFDPGDYIEFYATKNDGATDSLVYTGGSAAMPDTYYSNYNDTIYYFLTWNSSLTNRRMVMETDTTYSSYTSSDWFWTTVYNRWAVRYLVGELQNSASLSYFTSGEGWFSDYVNGLNSAYLDDNLNTTNVYQGPGAPDAVATAIFSGASNAPQFTGQGNHHMQVQYGSAITTVLDTVYTGYQLFKFSFQLPNASIDLASTKIRYQSVNDQGATSDYQCVSSSTIRYPHNMNLGGVSGFYFDVPFSGNGKSRLSLTNPSSASFVLYEIGDTVKKYSIANNSGVFEVLIRDHADNSDAQCFVTEASATINIASISPVNGTGDFTDFVALNPDSAFIIVTHPSLLSSSQQYANYRASTAGGSYNTVVANVEELYLQYGNGIPKHVLGIRRFVDDVMNNWGSVPSNLFLIGKSVREATESTNGFFPGTRQSSASYDMSLVPSFGYPSSDNLITAGLNGTNMQPAVPTGRLAARSNADVLNYLDKIQLYEIQQDPNSIYTIEDKDWMKQVLHFGGGSTNDEQSDFAGFLGSYETIIEDTLFGGNVKTYLKESSNPIDPIQFAEVMAELENGVSLMTFFGHSSINGFDQNLDEPSNWNNYGKYPFLIGNACYTGDIHQPDTVSASEVFVKEQDRGVIGFLSSVKLGFIGPLHLYTTEFYNQISRYNYGQPVGKLIQNTVTNIQPPSTSFIPEVNVCTQMTLHGDPALKLNYHLAPELAIRIQDIYFEPAEITLGDDSMNVNVIVSNIGKATGDSIQVELRRYFPDGADSVYTQILYGSYYKDTVVFRIPVQHNVATGINNFDVLVDIPSFTVEHYDENNNNQASATLFIYSNGITPVYPYDFAIVPDSILALKASTNDPLTGTRAYRFEIDTTDEFNSNEHRYQIVTAPGGVVLADAANWLLVNGGSSSPLLFSDSTVYFWRVSPDSSTYVWQEKSFQYIRNLRGWGQAHFYQFEDNYMQTMRYDRANRGWFWDPNIRKIGCHVYGNASSTGQYNGTLWTIDGDQQDYNGCGVDPAIHVAVVDPITLEAWGTYGCDPTIAGSCSLGTCSMINPDHQFGNLNNGCACRGRVEYYFNFRQNTPSEMDSLVSMVTNHIPIGHYVLLYTWRFADYSYWTPSQYNLFSSLGADSIYAGRPNEPFIVLARVGDPSFTKVVIGDSLNHYITMSDTLFGFDYTGSMTAATAGPATEWNALYWQQSSSELPVSDSARIYLYGITAQGTSTLLMDTLFTALDSIVNLQGIIDAQVYPYVKLKGWYTDTSFFTPAQTQRWQLVYTPAPEAAVNGSLGYYFSALNDSINEGQDLTVAVAIENISEYDMDSLLVHYWVEDENRIRNYLTYSRQDSLRAGEILLDTITFQSVGYPGLNSLWMEINPVPLDSVAVGSSVYDQLEQTHVNNFAQIPFYVLSDITNPILDVTFDGFHILNGDIISAKPTIMISLNDENQWLVMNQESDTAYFAVYVTDPAGNQRRVYFRNGLTEIMTWYPSSGPQGKFKIEYHPEFLVDGTYTLLIQASDKSGNASGATDYRIKFEVINKSTITEIMNYPNPFSTKTHFVFTLTGSAIPDYLKIQIMTITGKVVREITMDEIGDVHIGKNITGYYWDGTDQFGDQLANGIYLYRVVARLNGTDIEKRETGADQYFTKGFGKMYLMR